MSARAAAIIAAAFLALAAGCDNTSAPKPASVPVGTGSEATGYVMFETLQLKTGSAAEVQSALESWQRSHPEYRIRSVVPVVGGGGETLTSHSSDTTTKALVLTAYRDAAGAPEPVANRK